MDFFLSKIISRSRNTVICDDHDDYADDNGMITETFSDIETNQLPYEDDDDVLFEVYSVLKLNLGVGVCMCFCFCICNCEPMNHISVYANSASVANSVRISIEYDFVRPCA